MVQEGPTHVRNMHGIGLNCRQQLLPKYSLFASLITNVVKVTQLTWQ
jgi:hypothetical protein